MYGTFKQGQNVFVDTGSGPFEAVILSDQGDIVFVAHGTHGENILQVSKKQVVGTYNTEAVENILKKGGLF